MRTRPHLAVVVSVIALAAVGQHDLARAAASPAVTACLGNLGRSCRNHPISSPRRRWSPSSEALAGFASRPQGHLPRRPTPFTTLLSRQQKQDAGMGGHPWRSWPPDEPLRSFTRSCAGGRVPRRRVGCILLSGLDLPGRGAPGSRLTFNTANPRSRSDAFIVGVAEVRSGPRRPHDARRDRTTAAVGSDLPRLTRRPLVAWDLARWEDMDPAPESRTSGRWTQNRGVRPLWPRDRAGLVRSTSGGTPRTRRPRSTASTGGPCLARALPTGFHIRRHRRNRAGFTAVGSLPIDADHVRAVTSSRSDGATWTARTPSTLSPDSGVILAEQFRGELGRERTGSRPATASIAVGGASTRRRARRCGGSRPTARDWAGPTELAAARAGRPATPAAKAAAHSPTETLVGDGHRMLATARGSRTQGLGLDNGLVWSRLPVTGGHPERGGDERSHECRRGRCCSPTGRTTWFGGGAGSRSRTLVREVRPRLGADGPCCLANRPAHDPLAGRD